MSLLHRRSSYSRHGHEHFLQLRALVHLKVKIQSVKMTLYTQIQLS